MLNIVSVLYQVVMILYHQFTRSFSFIVSNAGHNLLSPYIEESGVGDPSLLVLTKL